MIVLQIRTYLLAVGSPPSRRNRSLLDCNYSGTGHPAIPCVALTCSARRARPRAAAVPCPLLPPPAPSPASPATPPRAPSPPACPRGRRRRCDRRGRSTSGSAPPAMAICAPWLPRSSGLAAGPEFPLGRLRRDLARHDDARVPIARHHDRWSRVRHARPSPSGAALRYATHRDGAAMPDPRVSPSPAYVDRENAWRSDTYAVARIHSRHRRTHKPVSHVRAACLRAMSRACATSAPTFGTHDSGSATMPPAKSICSTASAASFITM